MKNSIILAMMAITFHVSGQDLSGVSVDNMSDVQIQSILSQGAARGLSVDNGEALAISMGLPPEEAKKFQNRVKQLQGGATTDTGGILAPTASAETEAEERAEGRIAATAMAAEKQTVQNKQASSVYGQQLFRNGNLDVYERSLDAKAPDNYIIGAGDELTVSVSGTAFFNATYSVDSRGRITMNQGGSLNLRGLTFKQVERLIKARLRPYFNMSSNEVNITLAYSRTITVNIVGEVTQPGSYKLPAINTAFNALIAAGGPNNLGTLRNIEVRRNGKVIKTLDVYEYLLNPDSHKDFFLQDNDYLFVGLPQAVVGIEGAVSRPMRYELKQGESLQDLLTYAGSRTANAFMDLVQVKHLGASEVELIDVQASELGQFVLTDLDEVLVPVAQRSMERFVNVMGAVKQPGLYQYVEGMSAKALIDLAGGLHKDALLTRAYVRYEEEDKSSSLVAFSLSEADAMTLASKHELIVSFKPDVDAGFTVSIRGAVQTTSDQPFSEGMTLGDMIQMAGGLIPSADYSRIEISRLKAFDDFVNGVNLASNIDVETISLPSLVSRHDLSDKVLQFKLQPFDLIVVREIPEYHMQEMVTLSGEVRYPGAYPLMHKDEQISSVIERAGGVTSYSDVANAAFTRATNPNMVLHLDKALAKTSSKFNYQLKPGDEIHVPLNQSMVSIIGNGHEKFTYNQESVVNGPLLNNARANAYINRYALGFAKKAHRSRLFVSYPNGDVDRTVNYGLFLLYPKVKPAGTIHIAVRPEKEKKNERDVEPLDMNQVVATLAATMSSFATMYMLITR